MEGLWTVVNETAELLGRYYRMGSKKYPDSHTPNIHAIEDPLKRYASEINRENNADWIWDQVYAQARRIGYAKYIPDRGQSARAPTTLPVAQPQRKTKSPKKAYKKQANPEKEAWARNSEFDEEEDLEFWGGWFSQVPPEKDEDNDDEVQYVDVEDFP